MRVIRATLKALLAMATRVFFRDLSTVNAPEAGVAGRLFAANHWNGIVDPLVILTTARYDASPIAKAPLFSVPVLRTMLRVAEAVPVTRRRDAPDKSGADNDAVFDRRDRRLLETASNAGVRELARLRLLRRRAIEAVRAARDTPDGHPCCSQRTIGMGQPQ